MNIGQHIKEWTKTLAGVALIILFLKVTGLLGSVSEVAQSAVLQTGVMNASDEPLESSEAFNYDFTLQDLSGNKINFADYKGKVIFINLWATWCGPCRAEMKSIQKLYDQVDHNKIQFVMLSLDKDVNKDKVVKYIQDRAFSFPAFMPSGYLADQLNVPSIPTTFIISKQGNIVAKEVGMRDYNTNKFKKFLEKLTTE